LGDLLFLFRTQKTPASQTVLTGASVTFTVAASGTPAPTYQWQKNGAKISGATSTSYTIASVATGDAGTYTVVASNSAGSATSRGAVLKVNGRVRADIASQPASQTMVVGPSAPVDFNGDGFSDLLWQNFSTGETKIWLMNGTTSIGWVDLGTVPIQWSIVGGT
jgi:hypothetical protein